MDEKNQTHTRALTSQQTKQELRQIKKELADVKAGLKYIIVQQMIKDCGYDLQGSKDKLAICHQLPNLPDYYFDNKKFAEALGLKNRLSMRTLYNLGYSKKEVEEMTNPENFPITKKG